MDVVILPNPVWTDPQGDREAEAKAWKEFREIGWVDRRGRLDSEVLDSLHVLARPNIEYTAVFMVDGRQNTVVVAGQGDGMVMAYREGEAVTLTMARHQSLPETLLRQIPDARPAPIDPLNVRLSDPYAWPTPGLRHSILRRRSRPMHTERNAGRPPTSFRRSRRSAQH